MKVLLKNNSWAQGGKRRTLSDWQSTSPSLSLPFPSNPVCYSFPGCSWQSSKGTHIIGNSSMNSLRGWIIPLTAAGQQHAQPQTCWIKTYVHRAPSCHSGEKPLPVLSEAGAVLLDTASVLSLLMLCLGFSQGLFAVGRTCKILLLHSHCVGALSNPAQGRSEGPLSSLSILRFIRSHNSH